MDKVGGNAKNKNQTFLREMASLYEQFCLLTEIANHVSWTSHVHFTAVSFSGS